MRTVLPLCCLILLSISCHKGDNDGKKPVGCDMQQVYADNSKKVTITNGVWGTLSSIEGDCMPTIPSCGSCCRNCPVKRTVKIYQYATFNDAVGSDPHHVFFDSFTTAFVTQTTTDENGFFQSSIPAGHYTIVVVENGKLYANTSDGQGGISPFSFVSGTTNLNLTMTYKATF